MFFKISPFIVRPNVVQACGIMGFAIFCMMVMNTSARIAADHQAIIEIVFYRGLVCFVAMTFWMIGTGRYDLLKTSRPLGHIGRSLVGNISICLVFWSYSLMPMAAVTTILLTNGVMIVFLSILLLGERVGPWRWGAVVCGLLGCLIAANPTAQDFNLFGTLVCLGAMVCASFVQIFLRALGKTERAFTTVYYFVTAGVILSGAYMLYDGHLPAPDMVGVLLIAGFSSLAGLLLKSFAFRFAEASLLSSINYSQLIWSVLFGWIFWGEVPEPYVMMGASLVVAANLTILWREHVIASRHRD